MAGVKAQLLEDVDDGATPGAFEFYDAGGSADAGMIYCCPCGCGRLGALRFKPAASPSWSWDGNREAPTLSPSVHHIIAGVTHWHGWLRAGVWEPC